MRRLGGHGARQRAPPPPVRSRPLRAGPWCPVDNRHGGPDAHQTVGGVGERRATRHGRAPRAVGRTPTAELWSPVDGRSARRGGGPSAPGGRDRPGPFFSVSATAGTRRAGADPPPGPPGREGGTRPHSPHRQRAGSPFRCARGSASRHGRADPNGPTFFLGRSRGRAFASRDGRLGERVARHRLERRGTASRSPGSHKSGCISLLVLAGRLEPASGSGLASSESARGRSAK